MVAKINFIQQIKCKWILARVHKVIQKTSSPFDFNAENIIRGFQSQSAQWQRDEKMKININQKASKLGTVLLIVKCKTPIKYGNASTFSLSLISSLC